MNRADTPSPSAPGNRCGRCGVEVAEGELCPACRDFFRRLQTGAAGARAVNSAPAGGDPTCDV